MAMLEAFVYDPLISWRLLAGKNEENTAAAVAPNSGASADPTGPQEDATGASSSTTEIMARTLVLGHGDSDGPAVLKREDDTGVQYNMPIAQSMIDKSARIRQDELADEPDSDNLNAR